MTELPLPVLLRRELRGYMGSEAKVVRDAGAAPATAAVHQQSREHCHISNPLVWKPLKC
jgi:hypothetical protein